MNVKYSIIVPIYNVELFLRDCLDAILTQKYLDWEAICVDDGSVDGSGEILDEYSARDSRIKVIHKENAGVSSARNVGLAMAQGDWVLFVDADDLIAPDLLAIVNRAVSFTVNTDMVALGVIQFEERERPNWGREGEYGVKVIDCSNYYDEKWASLFSVWGKAFRRTTLFGKHFAPFIISEDYLFMVKYAVDAKTLLAVDTPCYGYRQRSTSVMHSGVTLEKIRDVMNANAEVIRLMASTRKRFSRRIRRLTARQLFDVTVVKATHLDDESKIQVFNDLKVYGREFIHCKVFPFETRVRLWLWRMLSFNDVAIKWLFGVITEIKCYLRAEKR